MIENKFLKVVLLCKPESSPLTGSLLQPDTLLHHNRVLRLLLKKPHLPEWLYRSSEGHNIGPLAFSISHLTSVSVDMFVMHLLCAENIPKLRL